MCPGRLWCKFAVPMGRRRTWPSGLAMSGVSRTMAWMLRPCTTTMERGTAGLPSNGWPIRQKSAGWKTCCMQATGPRCDWTCTTYPWMAIIRTLPRCSSSIGACFTVTTVYYRGEAGVQWKGRTLLEDHLWLHTHDHLGVQEGVPQADPSAATVVSEWEGTVGGSIPESPMPSSHLIAPGADTQVLLQVIHEDRIFGLAQVDIHTPEGLKDKFCDYRPFSSLSHCPGRMQSKQGTVQRESATSVLTHHHRRHCHSSSSRGSSSCCSGSSSSGVAATTLWPPPLWRGSTVIVAPGPVLVVWSLTTFVGICILAKAQPKVTSSW